MPPSEEKTRAWLSWLARGMQREGQTIFQIEHLQPSWLTSWWRRWLYYLASRPLEGIMRLLTLGHFGLFAAVIFFRPDEDRFVLSSLLLMWILIWGAYFGLSGGFVDLVLSRGDSAFHPAGPDGVARRGGLKPTFRINFALLFSFACFLPFLLFRMGPDEVVPLLITSAILGPILSTWWTWGSSRRSVGNDIQPVETLRATRSNFRSLFQAPAYSPTHWVMGLFIGSLIFIPAAFLGGGLRLLIVPLIAGAALVAQTLNLKPGVQELKTAPNRGTVLSARNGFVLGATYGALLLALALPLMQGPDWKAGVVSGLAGAIAVSLRYGGLEAAKHYILRFLLWRSGAMPWRYAEFLDYAAEELHFLQKVGGGYIFVHRYLLEHFAAMHPEGEVHRSSAPAVPQERASS